MQVSKENLHDLRCNDAPQRTEEGHRHAVAGLLNTRPFVKACEESNVHPVPCGLWDMAGSEMAEGSCNLAFGLESMHGYDLGVFLYIVNGMKEYLLRVGKAHLLPELNKRMKHLPRAEDSNLPICGGKYFPDHSNVQAKEHRNVMQILPHILNGIDTQLTRLACR